MKRLITVEEHYSSKAVNEKIRKVYEEHGTEAEKHSVQLASGEAAPGVAEMEWASEREVLPILPF